jgi:hypothetical protein
MIAGSVMAAAVEQFSVEGLRADDRAHPAKRFDEMAEPRTSERVLRL